MILVERAGPLTTFQDLGRRGWQHLGVPPSGAADRGALIRANRLVGNESGAVVLETTLAGPVLHFSGAALVALSGAPAPATAGGRPVPYDEPFTVAAGDRLDVGVAVQGLRTVIAVRGGFVAEAVLGSAATDILTGLGPRPIAAGDTLRVASSGGEGPVGTGVRPVATATGGPLEFTAGPRSDRFAAGALELLATAAFTVTPASSRIGVRLDGPSLPRGIEPGELLSEGVVTGAIQVPPTGRPIILLRDHPATGGYPVIGVLTDAAVDRAAQLRPGTEVRFALAGPGLADCEADES